MIQTDPVIGLTFRLTISKKPVKDGIAGGFMGDGSKGWSASSPTTSSNSVTRPKAGALRQTRPGETSGGEFQDRPPP
jgi:hypothetical protein